MLRCTLLSKFWRYGGKCTKVKATGLAMRPKLRRRAGSKRKGLEVIISMTLNEIIMESPPIMHLGGEQWAFYSIACCWWTSFPDDLGQLPDGLPCCPHCRSVLLQAPLLNFVAAAQRRPEHYGPGGIENFIKAHHRNNLHGRQWSDYEPPDEPA